MRLALLGLMALACAWLIAPLPADGQAPESTATVAEVRFDFAPDGSGGRYPSTIAAGQSTKLRLMILDQDGGAASAGSVAAVLVTTTAGSLSAAVGCTGGGLACQLPISAITASNADRLDVTLTHPGEGEAGRARVQATVLTAAGQRFSPPMRTVTFTGESSAGAGGSDPPVSPESTATVAEVRFVFAPDGSGGQYPSTIAAGQSTKLRLAILDQDGEAAAAGSVASVLVTTTVGSLSTTIGGGCIGGSGLACQLPISTVTTSNMDRLDVTLTHPGGGESGRTSLRVTVLAADGQSFSPPVLTATLTRESSTGISAPLPAGASIEISLVGKPDNTVTADGSALTVMAKLVYDGDDQRTLYVSDPVLRLSGSLEWEANGRSSLRLGDQSVSCTASAGQVSCPLNLVSDGLGPEIVVPPGAPAGTFTISATAMVGEQTARGSLLVAIVEDAPTEPTRPEPAVDAAGGFAFKLALVGQPDNAAAAGETIEMAASLVYAGAAAGAGSRAVSGIGLRVSGALEWEASGRSELNARDQTVLCAADGDQLVCPLDLQVAGMPARITIPAETPAGAFVISGAASVGGQQDRDALKVVIAAPEEDDEPAEALQPPTEPLSRRTPNNYAAYLSETPTTASVLLATLEGVSTLLIWDSAKWLRYGVVDGAVVPGSTDADIERGAILWLAG